MQAKDIMTTSVLSVKPETEISDIAKLLNKHHISAVPVLDKSEQLLGIVSEGDLFRREELGTERRRSWWLTMLTDSEQEAYNYSKSHGTKAEDIMTTQVFTITEDEPLREIANLLERHHIKRLPVVREGKVVGIVSRANLIQQLATSKPETSPADSVVDDRAIRESIIQKLNDELGLGYAAINVIVEDGTVHLWGTVSGEQERKAARIIAENTAGTVEVDNHLVQSRVLGAHVV